MKPNYFAVVYDKPLAAVTDKLKKHDIPCVFDSELFCQIRSLINTSRNIAVILFTDHLDHTSYAGAHIRIQRNKKEIDLRNVTAAPNTIVGIGESPNMNALLSAFETEELHAYFFDLVEFADFPLDEEAKKEFNIESTDDTLTLVNLRLETGNKYWVDGDNDELLCGDFIEIVFPGESTKDEYITVDFMFNPKGRYALTFGEGVYDTDRKVAHYLYYALFLMLRDMAENHTLPFFDIAVTAVWDEKQKSKSRAKTKR